MFQNSPLAIYIHWPYCKKKCPYCDFNAHIANDIDHEQWKKSYLKEIDYYADLIGKRQVKSVFFGGGTPSLMQADIVSSVLDAINNEWGMDDDCEITLETNPTSIEIAKFREFRAAGINRVSVGIQSLRDEQLQFLGREHNAKEALQAIDIAKEIFNRYTFDLIYARPGQALGEWEDELHNALDYAGGHLSLYQLMIEDGTYFKALRDSGRLKELDHDVAADMYMLTQDIMNKAGLPAYEISNHAAKGFESRHNMTYWQYGDYLGIGPGAHGRLTLPMGQKIATRTFKGPQKYLSQVSQYGHGAKPYETLTARDQMEERLMVGLRLSSGIDITDLVLDLNKLKPLFESQVMTIHDKNIKVMPKYWPVLDSVIAKTLLAL
jgi:putative oxygen-independent coproporphyrinogen III oxidase